MDLSIDDLVSTLRDFLMANEVTVFGGLKRQGKSRSFGQVVTSQHVQTQAYVFVEVSVPQAVALPQLAGNDKELEWWTADYTVVIDLVDYAQIEVNELEPYEIANEQFRIVCGRVCGLFMVRNFEISGQKSTYKRPADPNKKSIRVENHSALQRVGKQRALFAGLQGRITMTLTASCIGGT